MLLGVVLCVERDLMAYIISNDISLQMVNQYFVLRALSTCLYAGDVLAS